MLRPWFRRQRPLVQLAQRLALAAAAAMLVRALLHACGSGMLPAFLAGIAAMVLVLWSTDPRPRR